MGFRTWWMSIRPYNQVCHEGTSLSCSIPRALCLSFRERPIIAYETLTIVERGKGARWKLGGLRGSGSGVFRGIRGI